MRKQLSVIALVVLMAGLVLAQKSYAGFTVKTNAGDSHFLWDKEFSKHFYVSDCSDWITSLGKRLVECKTNALIAADKGLDQKGSFVVECHRLEEGNKPVLIGTVKPLITLSTSSSVTWEFDISTLRERPSVFYLKWVPGP